jgi:hypothetical protein
MMLSIEYMIILYNVYINDIFYMNRCSITELYAVNIKLILKFRCNDKSQTKAHRKTIYYSLNYLQLQ